MKPFRVPSVLIEDFRYWPHELLWYSRVIELAALTLTSYRSLGDIADIVYD